MAGEISDPETKDEKGTKSGNKPSQLEEEDQQKSSSEDENDTKSGNRPTQQEEEGEQNQSSEEENEVDPEKDSELKTKGQQYVQSSTEKADGEHDSTQPSGSGKQTGEGKSQILNMPEDLEGMSAPPASDAERLKARAKSRPYNPWARKEPTVRKVKTMIRPVSKQKDIKKSKSKDGTSKKLSKKKTKKIVQTSGTTSEENEDKPTTDVKTFSFPQYKILSGATVAPVKMRPQKVVVPRSLEEDAPKHWVEGLFQPSKMSLKLRLLRLMLVWIFFRVLNKQTGWLAEKLGIGLPDEPLGPPPPRPKHPYERYVRVFHESSPHPIHVRVRPTPPHGPSPHAYS